ncbi:hypothetical protein V490_04697 [Pseudogymnoascus sp. VKM F-3557]|nr:hypothetical protein V490_04697 [Pseudogymnoascus sp. VKM F-3557]
MKFSTILPLFAVLTAVIAQLNTGEYYIRALADDKPYIGRLYREDKSLLPKPVCEVQKPELASDGKQHPWAIQALPNNRFYLKARGAPTGVVHDLLFAFLVDQGRAEEWIIKRVPEGGPNVYTIETSSRPGEGWVTSFPDDEVRQVRISPLSPGPQVSQLFQIIP